MEKKELTKELYKRIIGKIDERKLHLSFIHSTWGLDFAEMQSMSTFDKGICFLQYVINIFSKYTWFVPLKGKKYYNF